MHLRVPARNEKVHLSSQELWSGKMRGRVQDLVTESFCNGVASLVIWVVLKMHIECCLAGVLTSFSSSLTCCSLLIWKALPWMANNACSMRKLSLQLPAQSSRLRKCHLGWWFYICAEYTTYNQLGESNRASGKEFAALSCDIESWTRDHQYSWIVAQRQCHITLIDFSIFFCV